MFSISFPTSHCSGGKSMGEEDRSSRMGMSELSSNLKSTFGSESVPLGPDRDSKTEAPTTPTTVWSNDLWFVLSLCVSLIQKYSVDEFQSFWTCWPHYQLSAALCCFSAATFGLGLFVYSWSAGCFTLCPCCVKLWLYRCVCIDVKNAGSVRKSCEKPLVLTNKCISLTPRKKSKSLLLLW